MKQVRPVARWAAVGESFKTTELQSLVDRIQAGDRSAADDLIRQSAERLESLARKMLKDFPAVARWEQTGDVLQNALTRLLRTLREVRPDSVAGFFRLAAQAVRRELLDMARHYAGPLSPAANHDSLHDSKSGSRLQGFAVNEDLRNLERWAAFHEAVERLPDEDREMIELGFYEGLTKDEIGRLLGVDGRTIRRRWNRASRRIADQLGDEVPV
jgi:RNA polymerase sigma factor (sigma-70 family)